MQKAEPEKKWDEYIFRVFAKKVINHNKLESGKSFSKKSLLLPTLSARKEQISLLLLGYAKVIFVQTLTY